MRKKVIALTLTFLMFLSIFTVAYAALQPDYRIYGLYVNGKSSLTINYKYLKNKPTYYALTVTVKASRSPYSKTYESVPVIIQLKDSKGQVLQSAAGKVALKSTASATAKFNLKLVNGTYYVVAYLDQRVTNGLTADQLKTVNAMKFLPDRDMKNNYKSVKVVVTGVTGNDSTLPPVAEMPKVDVKSRQELINAAWEFYKKKFKYPESMSSWAPEARDNYIKYFTQKGNNPIPTDELDNKKAVFYLFKANYTMNGKPLTDEEARLATAYATNTLKYDFYLYQHDLLANDKEHLFKIFGQAACEEYNVYKWNTNILTLDQINKNIRDFTGTKTTFIPYPYTATNEPETKAEAIYKENRLWPFGKTGWISQYVYELQKDNLRLGDNLLQDYVYITDYELTPGKDQLKSITVRGFLSPHRVKMVFDKPVNVILDLTDYFAEKTWQDLKTKPKNEVLVYKGTVYPWEEYGKQDPDVLVKVMETLKNNKVPVYVNPLTANTSDLTENLHYDLQNSGYYDSGHLRTIYDPTGTKIALSWTLNQYDGTYGQFKRGANGIAIKVGFNMTAGGGYDTTFQTLHETSDLTGFPTYLLQPKGGVNYVQLVNDTNHIEWKGNGGYAVPWYAEITVFNPY
ncbi:hypothetical protein ciss_01520 [Carboxydothermus islandicus]|uniref:Uncharacterized protein n=1 Tax=Carboxydothermus islandicus TaxID=661089 RepID=A0A1L8CZC9_9THEO|nr:hypothetical protein [Carboxydothermus islandicus]GAV24219.1 hypothetical protein ciss_01520 [Carboxydothermus islandicus]